MCFECEMNWRFVSKWNVKIYIRVFSFISHFYNLLDWFILGRFFKSNKNQSYCQIPYKTELKKKFKFKSLFSYYVFITQTKQLDTKTNKNIRKLQSSAYHWTLNVLFSSFDCSFFDDVLSVCISFIFPIARNIQCTTDIEQQLDRIEQKQTSIMFDVFSVIRETFVFVLTSTNKLTFIQHLTSQ